MRTLRAALVLAFATLFLAGAIARTARTELATGRIAATRWPYLPGSLLPLHVEGLGAPYHVAIVGPGRLLAGDTYEVPPESSPGSVLLVAGNAVGLAARTLAIGAAPPANRSMLFAACYDDGLVVHDAGDFSVLGILATGGVPSDVAVGRTGSVAVTDTQGAALTLLQLAPWSVARIGDVPQGDAVAIDATTHAIYVTNRDWNGGALTRVDLDGRVTRVVTGDTAEGLAIDERRQIVYVANTNDGTIAVVNARSMRVVRRFPAASRIFSLALSPDGTRLFGISNQSAASPFAAAGSAVAYSLRGPAARIVARSESLAFPLGIALDSTTDTLFVSDEQQGVVDVLDSATLATKHAPLQTCAIPWKLTFDAASERLYVPCAGSNSIDVFNARTLRRVARAPFATGGYPLAIAIWHP